MKTTYATGLVWFRRSGAGASVHFARNLIARRGAGETLQRYAVAKPVLA